jgi:hypothetical protein
MFDTSQLDRNWSGSDLNDLAAAVSSILRQSSFDLHSPLKLRNHGSGPAIKVIQQGGKQHIVLSSTDSLGRVVQLGFGAGSQGLTANELVPDVNYALDPSLISEALATIGGGPVDPERSLLGEGRSGSGVPHSTEGFTPRAGWGAALAGLQKSNDTEHAPSSAVKLTRDGNQYWWVTEPWKWQVVRCTVTAINADTLTCSVIANGKVTAETITVAKPCYMQQTPWDGVTVGSVTYTYSDSQHRDAATYGGATEAQVVSPLYTTSGPCTDIYAQWVGNKTDLSGVYWLDLNVDARQWFAV